jgi:hypothetical protein
MPGRLILRDCFVACLLFEKMRGGGVGGVPAPIFCFLSPTAHNTKAGV